MRDTELVGRKIGGYELLEMVGKGGMGAVFRARQISLDREVALKVLAPHLADNDEFVQRFQREARSIAKVNHPNILQVYDVGRLDALHFIAMEFVHGRNLSELLEERQRLPWSECAGYIRQAALGLGAAARVNIIHRDIKPDNLMITKDEVVKVSDFGLAKEVSSINLTQAGDVLGTPAFMSPEQAEGADLDTRSDIYSLGATFYAAVTGALPFSGPSVVAIMYKHKHEELVAPREHAPDLPEPVEAVITKMMAKDREARYQTMEEVADAIIRLFRGVPDEDELQTVVLSGAQARAAQVAPDAEDPAAKVDEEYEWLVEQGDALAKEGRRIAAVECWRRALQLKPGDEALRERMQNTKRDTTVAILSIGDELLEKGKPTVLRSELEEILREDPANADALERLTALEFMEDRRRTTLLEIRKLLGAAEHEKALQMWEGLHPALRDAALKPTMDNLRERVIPCKRLAAQAEQATREGRLEDARALWDEAVELDPANDKVKLGRQETQRYLDRLEEAVREGYEFHVQGKHESAIACFERALEINPHHAQARRYLVESALAHAREGEGRVPPEEAVSRWETVLRYDPENAEAAERIAAIRKRGETLEATIAAAREALSRGRYGRSVRLWREALGVDPGNKAAGYGLAEARRQRFRRRVLPVFVVLVLLVAGTAGGLHVWFEHERAAAIRAIERAEATGDLAQYDEAARRWRRAAAVPLMGGLREAEIAREIADIEIRKLLAREERAYAGGEGDLAAYRPAADAVRAALEEAGAPWPEAERAAARFRLGWREAHLLARRAETPDAYEAAKERYERAREAGSAAGLSLPEEQDRIRQAIAHYLLALDHLRNESMQRFERQAAVEDALQEAQRLWSGLAAANALLEEIRTEGVSVGESIARAEEALAEARAHAAAERHAEAEQALARALEAAEAILAEKENNWPARKIRAEVEWRREAGPGMAVFLHPVEGDAAAAQTLRAFALDRWEWPNRKGELPEPVSYAEARRLAASAGKTLPRLEEWLRAAGDAAALAEAWSPSGAVRPSGTRPGARTPSGLYDLFGNLAEWVETPLRQEGDAEQVVIGGHYAETQPGPPTDTRLRRADVAHQDVGFRAAKRWELNRYP
jgi:tetratricopeptide (TPR) repeat protein/predicted Ser/Thr protein kinase